jgi:hypothetical protein
MEFYFTDATRSCLRPLEAVDVVRGLICLEIVRIPPFVHTEVDRPQVSERCSIVRALEFQVSIEGGLVSQLINEELDFIEDTDMVLLVLDLEVAVSAGTVVHVNHVLVINELGELSSGGRTSPRAIMNHAALDNIVLRGRVCCGDIGESAGGGCGRRSSRVKNTFASTDLNVAGWVTANCGGQAIGRDCVGTTSLERASKIFCAGCH